MKKQTEVRFYHKGDSDYRGSVLFVADTKKAALEYTKDWLNAHSTKSYPFKKVANMDRWESKFSAIYLS